jgi:hypothetical protein
VKVPIGFANLIRERRALSHVPDSLEFDVRPMVGKAISLIFPIHQAEPTACVGTSTLPC